MTLTMPYMDGVPKEIGVYWWKRDEKTQPVLMPVENINDNMSVRIQALIYQVHELGGQWAGPLPVPEGENIKT